MSDSCMTPWTVARQAPLSMGFPSKNTEVDCHFLLQGIFPTQGSKPCLLALAGKFFTTEPPGKPPHRCLEMLKLWLIRNWKLAVNNHLYNCYLLISINDQAMLRLWALICSFNLFTTTVKLYLSFSLLLLKGQSFNLEDYFATKGHDLELFSTIGRVELEPHPHSLILSQSLLSSQKRDTEKGCRLLAREQKKANWPTWALNSWPH